MLIRLARGRASLLLLLLSPFVYLAKVFRRITGSKKEKREYISTISGDPLAYTGERPLVLSVWAPWTCVWEITAPIIEQMRSEFEGRCEFAYVEGDNRAIRDKYGVQVLPAVLVFHRGKEVARYINLIEGAELRRTISSLVV